MSTSVVVRYTVRSDASGENERLIRAVFSELAASTPSGVRYSVFRLEDGVTFVHAAQFDGEGSALTGLAAFTAFASTIGERAVDGPVSSEATVVGSYPPAVPNA